MSQEDKTVFVEDNKVENNKTEVTELKGFGPVVTERDNFGLIKGVKYSYKEEGRQVDWLSMIPSKYFVVNRQNFEKRGETPPTSIENVEDKDLLILLDGIKYIANLRGFVEVSYEVESTIDNCTAVCSIVWLPNFETENQIKTFAAIGDANINNTKGFGMNFLGPIAENRSFVRAVRNFLRIPILGKDEVDGSLVEQTDSAPPSNNKPIAELEKLMENKKVTFEVIKNKLVKEGIDGADSFSGISDLPKNVIFNLIERLQKKKDVSK